MRYSRNIGTLSQEEDRLLRKAKIVLVGCGGLGGHIAEELARMGVSQLTLIDGDVFAESNLNRQLFSNEENIGNLKVDEGKKRLIQVNSQVKVKTFPFYLDEENGKDILQGHDLIVDALDHIPSRLILEKLAEELDLPLVHGAIAGWYGQVSTILPGDGSLRKIYGEKLDEGIEKDLGNPSFTPALIASIQVSEVIKLIINRGQLLRKQLLFIDLLHNDFNIIDI